MFSESVTKDLVKHRLITRKPVNVTVRLPMCVVRLPPTQGLCLSLHYTAKISYTRIFISTRTVFIIIIYFIFIFCFSVYFNTCARTGSLPPYNLIYYYSIGFHPAGAAAASHVCHQSASASCLVLRSSVASNNTNID